MHARRARCFGSVAASYAQHRPNYPEQAVAWALGRLPDNARVLDLAAGTGKLTEALLRCGIPAAAVLAVEPDDGMRTQLSNLLPEVTVRFGTAGEAAPTPGAPRPRPRVTLRLDPATRRVRPDTLVLDNL